MDFFVLECECDGVSMSAKRCDESDSVVLGDSSKESKSNSKRFLRAPALSSAKLIGKLLPRTAMHGHS